MKEINLYDSDLKELSEEDLKALCKLNNIKFDELTRLHLGYNELININFITKNTPFVNLKDLWLGYNYITNINNIKYLLNLETLGISNLKLENEYETIKLFKTMKNLTSIWCHNVFTIDIKSELPGIKII